MDASTLLERVQFWLAVCGIGLSVGVVGWVLVRIVRRRSGRYLMEMTQVVGVTGISLALLKYLVSRETRPELETLSTIGFWIWLGSCGVTYYLHRMQTKRVLRRGSGHEVGAATPPD